MKWLLALACLALSLSAQSKDWMVVQQLPADQRIQVRTTNARLSGRLKQVTPDSIVVLTSAGDVPVPRVDVRAVSVRKGAARGRNAAIGAGIGFGVGFAIGMVIPVDITRVITGPVIGGLGALIGAPVGALIPGHSRIYANP